MDAFPLFRLPYVALTEFLKVSDPFELYNLSKCSTRMAHFIPLSRSKHFLIGVEFGRCASGAFLKTTVDKDKNTQFDYYFMDHEKLKLIDSVWPAEETVLLHSTCFTYLHQHVENFEEKCFYLLDLFRCSINSIELSDNGLLDVFMPFIRKVRQRQNVVHELYINIENFPDADFKWILDNLKIIDSLAVAKKLAPSSPNNLVDPPRLISMLEADWFLMDNMLSLKTCTLIEIHGTVITNEELTEFVELWKQGLYPNLQYMSVKGPNISIDEPIASIEWMEISESTGTWNKKIDDWLVSSTGGVEIQRNDDSKAVIELDREEITFKLFLREDSDWYIV